MKYLKRFNQLNESEYFKNFYKSTSPYHSLLDNKIHIVYDEDRITFTNESRANFNWVDIESDFIPLLELLTSKYKIFDSVIFRTDSDAYEYSITDVINDDIEIKESLRMVEVYFESPGANSDFRDKFNKLLCDLGYEDIDFDDDMVEFYNPSDSGLINSDTGKISEFIDEYGYDSHGFSLYGNMIKFPIY